VQDSANGNACAVERETCAQGSKGAHAHDESRTQKRYRIAQGIALEVFDGRDGSQLLYSAQVAMSLLHKKDKKG